MLLYSHRPREERESSLVSDNSYQPVQFIPGVPGTHHRRTPAAPPNHAGVYQDQHQHQQQHKHHHQEHHQDQQQNEKDRGRRGLSERNMGPKATMGTLADTRVKSPTYNTTTTISQSKQEKQKLQNKIKEKVSSLPSSLSKSLVLHFIS